MTDIWISPAAVALLPSCCFLSAFQNADCMNAQVQWVLDGLVQGIIYQDVCCSDSTQTVVGEADWQGYGKAISYT